MQTVTLIPGDGIGPEITESVTKILNAAGAKINWDIQSAGADVAETEGSPLPDRVIESIKKTKVALKAPVTTPIGKGFRSVNVALRKSLDLYANLRPCKNIEGIKTRFDNVDIVIVRENTEDLYAGIERQIDNDTAESIKIITRNASTKIVKFAFEYAKKNNRKLVTAVSKANICKLSDGLFLECAREVAKKYPQITFNFHSGNAEDIMERLDKGLLDFGLIIQPADISRYDSITLPNKDIWGVIMNKKSPLASKRAIKREDLFGAPLIMSKQIARRISGKGGIAKWLGPDMGKYNIVARAILLSRPARPAS